MDNLRAMKAEFISPEIVLQSLQKNLPNMKDVYVVAIDKDGEPTVWATGELNNLCFAAMQFQRFAFKFLNGEIDEDQ